MKRIEIIVHCYSEAIPEFASLLTAQLSSLSIWTPETCRVTVTICTSRSDSRTLAVIDAFAGMFWDRSLPVATTVRVYGKDSLFRRAIGRNDAAKVSQADIVHFADCDYLYGDGFLDALAALDFPTPVVFPRAAMITRSHAEGDAEIARIRPGEFFQPDLSLYIPWRPKFAIGGLQIVPGFVARRGYLDGSKWTRPVEAATFQNTAEDKVYRKSLGGSTPVDIPNLFRMRHSKSAFESAEKRLQQTRRFGS